MAALLDRLRQAAPTQPWASLDADASERLERFASVCPLYARLIEAAPELACWLESADTRDAALGLNHLLDELQRARTKRPGLERTAPGYAGFLRRFRRRMSLRTAYRDVAGWASPDLVVEELTRLAEMMIRECFFIATLKANERWGEPWEDEEDRAARFTVLGLGKLGGRELNFSSDIDLIYLYEGEGHTRRHGAPTGTTNGEYFQRVGEHITQLLNERDGDGFLFRTDLRLRPGGATAALAPSLASCENYYAATGQTWERLALLKARPVAGDFVTGSELLESLHSFRYPRHPPAALLTEVAAMKLRIEREVLGVDALARDIKSGFGGIREIEFLAQVLQLLHGAQYPFLQTHSTTEALRQLARYELLPPDDAAFLIEAYWLLRQVENRVQMAEEEQTHEIPDDPAARTALARTLNFPNAETFDIRLTIARHRVRRHYAELFASETPAAADPADPWWPFFADGRITPAIQVRLDAWFLDTAPGAAARCLQLFVRGEETWPLVREQVQRFAGLVPALDRVMPNLARPRQTLGQISAFAERYSSRNQFFAACTMNREFFEVLALLFDRSRFISELLTQHPEIFDEVLRPEILRKRKDVPARRRELVALADPAASATEFPARLWLYVRAEQVRASIGHLLGFVSDDDLGADLSGLADAVLLELVARTPGADELLLIALGTYGGSELSYGSDLDLVVVGRTGEVAEEQVARAFFAPLGGGASAREPSFRMDFRLRPHGDAGPLVSTLTSYRDYFSRSAQTWERLALTRARIVSGPPDLATVWQAWVNETIFGRPLTTEEASELWRMRLRVQRERDVVQPPQRAFKAAAGGLADHEFSLQILQLHHGGALPAVRDPGTRAGWQRLAEAGLVTEDDVALLLDHHRELQRIEWCLRRDQNRAVNVIPEAPEDQRVLACWLGARDWATLWEEHCRRLEQTRITAISALTGVVPSTTLETSR